MHDAELDLDLRLRELRLTRLGKALQPIHAHQINIADIAASQLGQDIHPELSAFVA
jgi:hypothetical protein